MAKSNLFLDGNLSDQYFNMDENYNYNYNYNFEGLNRTNSFLNP